MPRAKRQPSISTRRGSWGRFLAALPLLSLLLVVPGCRLPGRTAAAPPSAHPLRARLADLIALHPNQPLVRDLDAQLARLAADRQRLAGTPAPSAPPTAIAFATPDLPALPSPDATPVVQPPWAALHQAELSALRESLTYKAARETTRFQRQLAAEYAGREEAALVEQARMADAEAVALHEAYRLRITRLQLEQQYAREQFARYPQSKETQQRVVRADAAYAALVKEYNAALQDVRKRQEQANASAARTRERERAARAAAHTAQQQETAEQRLADAEARQHEEAGTATPRGASAIAFPPLAGAELTLDTGAVDAPAIAAQAASRAAAADAVRALDEQIHALQRSRAAVVAEITQETRLLATTLAQRRGYQLDLARDAAATGTGMVRRWLQEYWQTDLAGTEG